MLEEGIRNRVEGGLLAQVADVFVREAQALQIIERRIHSGSHQVGALRRQVANEKLKRGTGIHAVLKIARRHRQLVQINQQRRIAWD